MIRCDTSKNGASSSSGDGIAAVAPFVASVAAAAAVYAFVPGLAIYDGSAIVVVADVAVELHSVLFPTKPSSTYNLSPAKNQ